MDRRMLSIMLTIRKVDVDKALPWQGCCRSGGQCSVNCLVDFVQGGVGGASVDEADHVVAVHALSGEIGGELLDGGHCLESGGWEPCPR